MDSETELVGVFGYPVRHSMSPIMHNTAFKEMNLNMRYAAFEVKPDSLEQAVNGIRALQFRGINVTIPHKVEIIPFLDQLDDEAKEIEAVNMIVNENGILTGYNTDGKGYVASLVEETGMNLKEQRVLVMGAGGGARAIVISLARSGVQSLWIANRTKAKADELAAKASIHTNAAAITIEEAADKMQEATLFINCTSMGMHPNVEQASIDTELIHRDMVVSDLVYNPLQTKLLYDASQKGAKTHGGVGMLVHQGVIAFQHWTGREAPVDLMRRTVLSQLER